MKEKLELGQKVYFIEGSKKVESGLICGYQVEYRETYHAWMKKFFPITIKPENKILRIYVNKKSKSKVDGDEFLVSKFFTSKKEAEKELRNILIERNKEINRQIKKLSQELSNI